MESQSRPAESQEPSLLKRVGRGPLVGRRRELAEALAELHRVGAGEGRALLISGEPGVGKTRLAREIMAQVQAAGGVALLGECYAEGDVPYAPVSRMIRASISHLAALELSGTVLADLVALAPALRSRYPAMSANPSLDPQLEQQRLFESLAAWCEALSARAPLLLFVDDVQWADGATLSLLRHLARSGRQLRLLLVLTMRESEVDQAPMLGNLLHDLNRERLATHLRLGRLDRAETGALLAAMFAEETAPDFLDGIYGQTDGNPFFVEEVCKALIEEGKLAYRDGRWHRPSMAEIKVPQTVRAAIQARVARVPARAQEALRLAAIVGQEFEFETLLRAGDLDEETLIAALESAVRAQLIAEVEPRGDALLRFSFVHVLIPTTLRESTIHVRRRLLHRRVAGALEALRPDDFEALAYHYAGAGDAAHAREYLLRAGDRAQTWAPEEAARLYRAALELWPAADEPGRAQALARLGHCLWVTADLEGALECYEAAYRLFDRLGNRLQAGEMQRRIGRVYWEQPDRVAALQHYHQAFAILAQAPESVELAWATSSLSQIHMLGFEPEEAITWSERALAMAERLGAEDVIVDTLNNLGSTYSQIGDWEKGLELLQASVGRAQALQSPVDSCRGYCSLAVALQRQCCYDEAIDWFERLHAYATRAFVKIYVAWARWRLMWINWDVGRWGAALAWRSQAIEMEDSRHVTWTRRVEASMDLDLGRIAEPRRALEATLTSALRADDLQTTVPHLGQLIRAYGMAGQVVEAARTVETLLECLARRPYPFVDCIMPLLFACQWLATQPAAEVPGQTQACLSHLQRLDAELHTEESRAALAEAQACLLLAEGRAQAAAEHFHQAGMGWARTGRPYDQARAQGSLGRALAMAGDPSAATAAYAQARDILDWLAAQLDAEQRASFLASPRVEEIRGAARAQPAVHEGHPNQPGLAGLTERELDVLRLVAQGLTNAQIAERLVVSPLTVNAHLRSIFNKLDVTRRAAAARFAVEHGLA